MTDAKVQDIEDQVKKQALTLLEKMGVVASIEVAKEGENLLVNVESEEHKGLLIGARGESLTAFQTILNLIAKNESGEWQNILVNVGDWREKQEDYLISLAKHAAARAVETGKPQQLYNLNPGQRKVVHTYLATDDSVVSESEGEGRERFLVIRAKGDGATQ